MKWESFSYEGVEYNLSHLQPFEWICIQEAKAGKPERQYQFDVIFSMHCFTRKIEANDMPAKELLYSDSRETRCICFKRYEQSKILADIIQTLNNRKCMHTGHGNYLTIEIQGEGNESQNYEIYFTVSKSSKKGYLNLYIDSAYIRDREHGKPPKNKPIKFYVIAFNTQAGKKIKIPK
ncbi:MAG: hypothetical protein QM504_16940 [Pseudomonadota bacterium]